MAPLARGSTPGVPRAPGGFGEGGVLGDFGGPCGPPLDAFGRFFAGSLLLSFCSLLFLFSLRPDVVEALPSRSVLAALGLSRCDQRLLVAVLVVLSSLCLSFSPFGLDGSRGLCPFIRLTAIFVRSFTYLTLVLF